MAKVSLIMPAYNAREYIRGSVGSVLAQTHTDLELIVVNDGSKDDTAAILAEMAAEDSRLRPFTVENGGPAKARNYALEQIAGDSEFVMFIDSDDAILPDTVEYALQGVKPETDMVLFGFTIVSPDGSERNYCEPENSFGREKLGENLAALYKANLLNQVWGKLYRAKLIRKNDIRFPDYRWGEDRIFIFGCLEHCAGISVLPECRYRYIMHPGESLITKFLANKADICIEIDRRMAAICESCGVTDDSVFRYMFAKSIFSCLTNLYSPSCRLSGKEKDAYIASVISNPYVLERCRGAAGGLPVKLLTDVMNTGSVPLNRMAFRAVAEAGKVAPKLFMKIKHRK